MRQITIGLALVALAGCLGTGCAGKDATFEQRQAHMAQGLDALRQARFKGSFMFNEGGSALGVNASTNWSLGPQQVTLYVNGDVDFTEATRTPEKP